MIFADVCTTELAWCAGLMDGEGCISIYRFSNCRAGASVMLRLVMTDEICVRRFARILGVGIVRRYVRPGRRPYYRWYCGRREEVGRVLSALRPYLIAKTSQAIVAQEFLNDVGADHFNRIRKLKVL